MFGQGFGIPRERVQSSLGSGVIISGDGVIVTNTHVVKGGTDTQIRVALADKREFDAKIVAQDDKTDLAVLKIDSHEGSFPFLEFSNSDQIEVGDLVLAIGDPFGVGQTVTQGIGVRPGADARWAADVLPVLHPDGRCHQPGQFGRGAGGHACAAGRHQFGHLLAVGRQRGHRLRDSGPIW